MAQIGPGAGVTSVGASGGSIVKFGVGVAVGMGVVVRFANGSYAGSHPSL